jgi:beta-mannosidase
MCLNLGDAHYYNFTMDTWNGDNYPITRFLSETGIESMPSLETWQQITNSSEDLSFTSTLVENREHHGGDGQEELMFVSDFDISSFSYENII